MVSASLALALASSAPGFEIKRDSYGVPLVQAETWEAGWEGMGYAVAEDRLWQMELSRRLARGRMAELGEQFIRSDESTLKTAPTDAELEAQVRALPPKAQAAFAAYARGVNASIASRAEAGTLPKGYAENGLTPEPWTVLDSAAVAVGLIRRFGTGGAGELRAMALYEYLKTQKLNGRELDVLDDIAWHNDPRSPVTLKKEDEGPKPRVPFFDPLTRAKTLAHLQQLPKVSLLELAGAAVVASNEPQQLVAQNLGVAHKWGSYAVVASPARSKTGRAWLLGAPQMGHSTPSVIHESALRIGQSYRVQGITVPGVPFHAIGSTPDHAWTLTTGAADVEDIFFLPMAQGGGVQHGSQVQPLVRIEFPRKVKGGRQFTVVQERTKHGPVLLKSLGGKAVFSLQSALHGRELTGIEALYRMGEARGAKEVREAAQDAFPCFNFFYALTSGEIGWRFTGKMPVRARGLDPRFPTPSRPENEWQGFLSPQEMPQVVNPKSGLLVNWNNKPVSWWTNGDTPAWGRFFRSRLLEDALPKGKVSRTDLELAAWTIARRDTGAPQAFRDVLLKAGPSPRLKAELEAADGWALAGSTPALALQEGVLALRQEIFGPIVGSLTSPSLFNTALQPEVILAALEGRTKFPYLRGREGVLASALARAEAAVWQGGRARFFVPGSIRVPDQPPIPYINRGTFIQVVELQNPPISFTVASPGNSESGPHAFDQTSLARAWLYKPAWGFGD